MRSLTTENLHWTSFLDLLQVATEIPKAILNTRIVDGFRGIPAYPIIAAVKIKGPMFGNNEMRTILADLNRNDMSSPAFSCSQVVDRQLFENTVRAAAIESGRAVSVLHYLTQPADHPVCLYIHRSGMPRVSNIAEASSAHDIVLSEEPCSTQVKYF